METEESKAVGIASPATPAFNDPRRTSQAAAKMVKLTDVNQIKATLTTLLLGSTFDGDDFSSFKTAMVELKSKLNTISEQMTAKATRMAQQRASKTSSRTVFTHGKVTFMPAVQDVKVYIESLALKQSQLEFIEAIHRGIATADI